MGWPAAGWGPLVAGDMIVLIVLIVKNVCVGDLAFKAAA